MIWYLLRRIFSRRGYTCDDCGAWTPRYRGRAYVRVERLEHAAIPSLPREPVVILDDDPRLARITREIVSGRRTSTQRVVLRCPACADAYAMWLIEAAAKELASDAGAVVAWAERTVERAAA